MRLFSRTIQDENRRELTFLRESLGLEGYLNYSWAVRNDGKGEKDYPPSHKDGYPITRIEKPKVKLAVVRQVETKPAVPHTQMRGNINRSDGI